MQLLLPDSLPDSLYLTLRFALTYKYRHQDMLAYIVEDVVAHTAPKYSMISCIFFAQASDAPELTCTVAGCCRES